MTQQTALQRARSRYGDCNTSIAADGTCVISLRELRDYVPLGYGATWEDALIDSARNYSFTQDCAYA